MAFCWECKMGSGRRCNNVGGRFDFLQKKCIFVGETENECL